MWTAILLIAAYLTYNYFAHGSKMGYVIIGDVYSQFALKKEMQAKYEHSHNARKKVLDSMAMNIKALGERIDAEKGKDTSDIRTFKMKRMEFYERNRQIGQDDSAQLKQYDDEILSQLNQYIKDYGKENHYQFIFGNASGALMAADESLNITAQVTQYVNEKYNGKK